MSDRCEAANGDMRNCPRPAEYVVDVSSLNNWQVCRQHLGRVVAEAVDNYSAPVTVRYSWKPTHV